MAQKVTSVLTAGTNSHPTTAEEANYFLTDFITPGILGTLGNTLGVAPATGGYGVNANGTPNMTVIVNAGVAYIATTPSGQASQNLRTRMTATESVVINNNATGSTKYDWIYLKHDPANANNPNVAGDNVATFVTSRSTNASTDDGGNTPTYGRLLAVVTVPNGAVAIANSQIRDARSAAAVGSANTVNTGWNSLSSYLSGTIVNNGDKSYTIPIQNIDLTGQLSKGMRFKASRSIVPPTQSADFESSSSQYAIKTSPTNITFTDDFTIEAWVKIESYTAGGVLTRFNGTSGFLLRMTTNGTVVIDGRNGGGANLRTGETYRSLPLNRWVHIAATLDMSAATANIYINGALVPTANATGGTNPTSLLQAGNLELGSWQAANFFDGEIAEARLWSTIRNQTQIRDNMNQTLVGNEANLNAYFPLNGNFNDLQTNFAANNLTSTNGAIATAADNPMNAIEMGIIHDVVYSAPNTLVTVFTGTDYNIPNMSLSNMNYATDKTPYGFPGQRGKWCYEIPYLRPLLKGSISNSTWVNLDGGAFNIPVGSWQVGYNAQALLQASSGGLFAKYTLSTANNSESDPRATIAMGGWSGSYSQIEGGVVISEVPIDVATITQYFINAWSGGAVGTINIWWYSADAPSYVRLYSAYA